MEFSDVTHQRCGGIVVFAQRRLDGDDVASTVLFCPRCQSVIESTDDLQPQGAVCGVALRDVQAQRSAA